MSFIGAIDQGTSSSRFVLYEAPSMRVVGSASRDYDLLHPSPGWAEIEPRTIIDTVNECIEEVMKAHGGAKVEAVGITNQRETTLVWDKETGEPLYNAIVWLDTRTSSTLATLLAAHDNDADCLRALTGLPLSTYFSALKLRWMLDNVPRVREAVDAKCAAFGTVDAWLLYSLTRQRVHATDVTNASRTMFMDVRRCAWSDEACAFFDVPRHVLPEIRASADVYGEFARGALAGVRLAACLGDQQAALVGHGCFARGDAKNT